MPISIVHIADVSPYATSVPGLNRFRVDAENWERFWTVNAFKASLCERARALGVPVKITWKDGRFGSRDLVFVEIEP